MNKTKNEYFDTFVEKLGMFNFNEFTLYLHDDIYSKFDHETEIRCEKTRW